MKHKKHTQSCLLQEIIDPSLNVESRFFFFFLNESIFQTAKEFLDFSAALSFLYSPLWKYIDSPKYKTAMWDKVNKVKNSQK